MRVFIFSEITSKKELLKPVIHFKEKLKLLSGTYLSTVSVLESWVWFHLSQVPPVYPKQFLSSTEGN